MHATLIFKHFDWLSAENCFKEISLIVLHFTVQKIASAHSWTCDFWSLKQLLCQELYNLITNFGLHGSSLTTTNAQHNRKIKETLN